MPRRSLIHEVEATERSGRWFPATAGLIVIAMLASTWVGLFTFMSATAAYGTFSDLEEEYIPDTEGMELGFPDFSRVSRVYSADDVQLAELHDGRITEPTQIQDIPEVVIYAVLAAEDGDFYEHEGVDFRAIASAAIDNVLYDGTRGGSTITQQLTKNLFVGDEITIQRKIAEAIVAAELERRFDKDVILEFYLNSVFFGSNAYGVTAAAREYFGKSLNQLQVHEAATIAVLIRNPTLYNPRQRPELVRDRRDGVLRQMAQREWITEAQAEAALRQPLAVQEKLVFRGPADHVVAEVKRQILDLRNDEFDFLGETAADRKVAIFGCAADATDCSGGGGLRIETTLNLDKQLQANGILSNWFPLLEYEENFEACKRIFPQDDEAFLAVFAETESCVPTGAIATVDNVTGAILVMASGLPFEEEQFDLATQGRRNPGSSMKPIALVAALEQGISLRSFWPGGPTVVLECPSICSADGTNQWTVRNAGGGGGSVTLEAATYRSINTAYAALSLEVGPENVLNMARRMGITSPDLQAVPSIVLGTGAISPLEMASAFSNFATNGLHAKPYLISRIFDASGELLYERQLERNQVAAPEIFAAARAPLLRVPTAEGTAPRANIGVAQGGKTGTHQNYTDAFYVGFTPEFSTAVWTGYPTAQVSLENVTINGQFYARVFGGSVPAPIWGEFMSLMVEGREPTEFVDVEADLLEQFYEVPTTIVPSVIGLDKDSAFALARARSLYPWEVLVPSLEPAGTVTGQSQIPGTEVSAGSTLYMNVSTGQIPQGQMPNVIGMTYDQALETFRQLEQNSGVRVTVTQSQTAASPDQVGKVLSTNPPPGSIVNYGGMVTLVVGA
ncbi:MAG TPA: transglycosylase domain-containing protein [Acidimicrobiia bacterium]|nr:transglycosylase domain-containing protein [Acidimicrobiia bacterium]